MVPVAKVADAFHARVLAARFGSEGLVTQLRGGGVDGPYPVGDVEVLVSAPDLDTARELLLADEVESAFDEGDIGDGAEPRPALAIWIVALIVAALVLFAYVSTFGYHRRGAATNGAASGQQGDEFVLVQPAEGPAPVASP